MDATSEMSLRSAETLADANEHDAQKGKYMTFKAGNE